MSIIEYDLKATEKGEKKSNIYSFVFSRQQMERYARLPFGLQCGRCKREIYGKFMLTGHGQTCVDCLIYLHSKTATEQFKHRLPATERKGEKL